MKPRCETPMTYGKTGEPTTCGRIAGHAPDPDGYPGHKSAAASERDRQRVRARTAEQLAVESICTRGGCQDIAPVGWTYCLAHKREAGNKAMKARYRRRVDALIQRFGGRCIQCGSTERLEFDHVDWRTKVDAVTSLVNQRAAADVVDAELSKCQLLCRSCHIEKTKRDRAEQRAELHVTAA